jgi:hypothetical protein
VLVRIQQLALDACEFSTVRQPDQPSRISQAVLTIWRDGGCGRYKLLGPSGPGTDCVVYVFVFLDGIIVFSVAQIRPFIPSPSN